MEEVIMRKSATGFLFMLIILLAMSGALFAEVDFALNDWGRIRLIDGAGTRHLDRVSINFGVDQSTVYHYKDVGGVQPIDRGPMTAAVADSEYYGFMDYNTGDVALNVEVKHHIFWWKDKVF
jgi:hypothetical protein